MRPSCPSAFQPQAKQALPQTLGCRVSGIKDCSRHDFVRTSFSGKSLRGTKLALQQLCLACAMHEGRSQRGSIDLHHGPADAGLPWIYSRYWIRMSLAITCQRECKSGCGLFFCCCFFSFNQTLLPCFQTWQGL